ncbi:MAG: sigma-70 family RNA polymerase sigma factor [bacterium]
MNSQTRSKQAQKQPMLPTWASESELVELVQQEVAGAFEELERRYRPKILQQLRQLCRDQEDMKDILQDVLMALFLKIKTFQGRSSLSTWIYRVTINAYLMHERKQKRNRLFFVNDAVQDLLIEASNQRQGQDTPSPLSHIFRTELRSKLNQALSELPPGYRDVFLALKGDELSLKEVSRQMGISIPAVKSRQHRAREFLKSRLLS